jgi:hypothetical protein
MEVRLSREDLDALLEAAEGEAVLAADGYTLGTPRERLDLFDRVRQQAGLPRDGEQDRLLAFVREHHCAG